MKMTLKNAQNEAHRRACKTIGWIIDNSREDLLADCDLPEAPKLTDEKRNKSIEAYQQKLLEAWRNSGVIESEPEHQGHVS